MDWKKIIPILLSALSKVAPRLSAKLAIKLFLRPDSYTRPAEELAFWNRGEPIKFPSGCFGRIYGPKNGKIVWFLHGWGSRGSRFLKIVEACEAAGFRCVVWEGPAHGDSPGKKRIHLANFTKTFLEDLRAQAEPYAFVGFSFGGAAVPLAARLGAKVEKLVMISAPTMLGGVLSRYWQALRLSKKAQEYFRQILAKEVQMNLQETSAGLFAASLTQKILVLHDKEDREVPYSDAEAICRANPKIQLFTTSGLGHRRILLDQAVIEKITGFLQ